MYSIGKIFKFGKGGGVVNVDVDLGEGRVICITYRIVKAKESGKLYAFAPQEKRDGKSYNQVFVKPMEFAKEIQEKVLEAYLADGAVEDAPF